VWGVDVSLRALSGDGGAPRFALAEPAGSRVQTRLAAIGWTPTASAKDVGSLDPASLASCQVLVVGCAERLLMSPALQIEVDRVAPGLPRVAVVTAPSPEAAVYAAQLGWGGFVSATSGTAVLARTIAAAARGDLAFPPSAAAGLARALALVARVRVGAGPLTPRQQQIVRLIAEGATDAEIAELLHISRFTAHKHVQNARRRLGAKTRGQLVAASQVR